MIVHPGHISRTRDLGGKADSLMRLFEANFDVPPFMVIPSGVAIGADALDAALRNWARGPYAVRSSGLAEDGAEHSHAGQYESILDVEAADVHAAVARVLASAGAEGLAAYRRERGIEDSEGPAVIVQRMVRATVAGVAFSADPVSGRRDRIVVSAVAGLADRLVSGEVDGSSWWLDHDTGDVVASTGDADLMDAAALASVADLVRRVEAMAGVPQDVEWAFEGDRLYVLQARAITSPLRDPPVPDTALSVFDNSNIVESYPGVVSPLTFSFAQYAYARVYVSFLAVLGVDGSTLARERTVFENMLSRIDGRVYYNLGNWYRALAMLPGYSLNSGYMETMMGVGAPLPAEVSQGIRSEGEGRGRIVEWSRVARTALGLVAQAFRLDSTARGFRARLDRALSATTPEKLATMSATRLAAEYRRIEADLLDRWDAPIVNDFLCMIAFGASRRMLEKWVGPQGLEIHNEMLIGQGDIVSAMPPVMIREMGMIAACHPEVVEDLEAGDLDALRAGPLGPMLGAYIDRFGDRCTEELKLESVTLDEDPRSLVAAVLSASRAAPRDMIRVNHADERLQEAMAGRPVRHFVARRLLGWSMARVRDRENLRYERTRLFGRARRLFLAIGRRFHSTGVIDDPRDVFLLTVDEILGSIEGFAACSDLRGMAAVRRAEMAAAAVLPDPPERILVRGAACTASGRVAPPAAVDHSAERRGTGCSAGSVRAVARVVLDPRGQAIARGEILVARHTDPGWIALFASASAIVVERGSLLSHSAIVAREMGIPCVVGLSSATDWIRDGETIEVDGSTGMVRRMAA
jgi:phosphohistidine swiveling domain-containing protein